MLQSPVGRHGRSEDPHRRRRPGHPSSPGHAPPEPGLRDGVRIRRDWGINTARKERPDVILLDLALPGGDGYLVMERLGSISTLEGTPVIVVSARDPKPEEERLVSSAAAAFFQKPIDHEHLLGAIARALGDEDGP